MTMRKHTLTFVATLLFVAGCATQKFIFDPNKASAYLSTHKDRPAQIVAALSEGKPVVGMTEEEVELCWGVPQKKITGVVDSVSRASWGYFKRQAVASSAAQTVWMNVLVKEVQFTNGVLRAWQEIGDAR